MSETKDFINILKQSDDFLKYLENIESCDVLEIIDCRQSLITQYGLLPIQQALLEHFESVIQSLSSEDNKAFEGGNCEILINTINNELTILGVGDDAITRITNSYNQEQRFKINI